MGITEVDAGCAVPTADTAAVAFVTGALVDGTVARVLEAGRVRIVRTGAGDAAGGTTAAVDMLVDAEGTKEIAVMDEDEVGADGEGSETLLAMLEERVVDRGNERAGRGFAAGIVAVDADGIGVGATTVGVVEGTDGVATVASTGATTVEAADVGAVPIVGAGSI